MRKRLSKYIASFDYFDKSLTFLSAASGGIPIASFATAIGTPVGIAFSLSTGLVKNNKKLLKMTRNRKKACWQDQN